MKRISMFRIQLTKTGSFLFDFNVIRTPKDAEVISRQYFNHCYDGLPDREVFGILWLNTKNVVIGCETVSIGTVNASLVHPREVFKSGILHNSTSFVCFHNHPSGFADPSPEDISITRRLQEVGTLLGIELLDHIILSDDSYTSMQKQGLF
ncbi:hypothetical protein D3C74_91690 [compost metagenome]